MRTVPATLLRIGGSVLALLISLFYLVMGIEAAELVGWLRIAMVIGGGAGMVLAAAGLVYGRGSLLASGILQLVVGLGGLVPMLGWMIHAWRRVPHDSDDWALDKVVAFGFAILFGASLLAGFLALLDWRVERKAAR